MANEREVYRKVYLRLWRHEEFQKLADGERVLTLYLVSGPQTNAIGCYHFSPGLACEDLGISMSQLRRRLHAVLTAFGWQHDETRRLMWITSWLKWNRPNGADATKAWQAEIETLPDCEAKRCLRDGIAKLTAKSTGRLRDAIGDAIYDGVATQDQDQEQEQKQDQNQDLCVHTPEQRLWHAWRARSAAAGVVLPIEPRHAEAMKVLEACQKVPDESVR